MIIVNNLSYDYPGLRALDSVSFSLPEGSITALVGPNGAGKTTLLRCLAALEEPVSGSVLINGTDALSSPRECHKHLGYLSDFFGLYEGMTVRQCLLHAAAVNGITANRQQDVASLAATRLGIAEKLDSKAGQLSRGQRQRLAIAQAIVHEPKVLLLDEPASGLDPEARHSLAELFIALRDQGMTLLVSSHILSELEEYSTDMLVLRNGRIVSQQSVKSSRSAQETGVRLTVTLSCPVSGFAEQLARQAGISDVTTESDSISFRYSEQPEDQRRLLKGMIDAGIPVCSFWAEKRSMHDTYLATVKESSK